MYNGIGLPTVRGTATSGHVQANRGHVSASRQRRVWSQNQGTASTKAYQPIQAAARLRGNADIQFHAAKRQLENDLLLLREELEDDEEGLAEEELDKRIDAEREKRMAILAKEHEERLEKVKQQQATIEDEETNPLSQQQSQYENGPKCFNCGQVGHLSRECNEPRKERTCYHCGEPGHLARGCPNREERSRQRDHRPTNTHLAALHKEEETGRLAEALGIRKDQHQEGKAFDFEGQKERKRQLQQEQQKLAEKEEKARRKAARKEERRKKREAKKERRVERKRRRRSRSPSYGSESEDSRSYSSESDDSRKYRRSRRRRSPSSSVSRDKGDTSRRRKDEIPREIEPLQKRSKRRESFSDESSSGSRDDEGHKSNHRDAPTTGRHGEGEKGDDSLSNSRRLEESVPPVRSQSDNDSPRRRPTNEDASGVEAEEGAKITKERKTAEGRKEKDDGSASSRSPSLTGACGRRDRMDSSSEGSASASPVSSSR